MILESGGVLFFRIKQRLYKKMTSSFGNLTGCTSIESISTQISYISKTSHNWITLKYNARTGVTMISKSLLVAPGVSSFFYSIQN